MYGGDQLNDNHTAQYLAPKLREKLALQLEQAWDFAGLTYAAGPELVVEWARLDLDDQAFTPGDYAARTKSRPAAHRSVYVLDQSEGKYVPRQPQSVYLT